MGTKHKQKRAKCGNAMSGARTLRGDLGEQSSFGVRTELPTDSILTRIST